MPSGNIPDPFYVDLMKAIGTLEAEVKNLQVRLELLVTAPEIEAVKNEIIIHRAVMGGFFVTLITICGWLIASK